MAEYERWPCKRIARQRGWVEIDKNEGGGYKNEEKKRKRGREGKMKRGDGGGRKWGGGKETCSQLFTFSSRLVDRN